MKLVFLIFTLFSFQAFANIELRMKPLSRSVAQGELFDVVLSVHQSNGVTSLKGLSGKHFAESLYIYSLDPFVLKNGQLESNAKVIFSKIPKVDYLQEEIEGSSYIIKWSDLTVTPTTEAEGFKFGNFEIPKTWPVFSLVILLILLMTLALPIKRWLAKRKNRELHKIFIKKCLAEMESASTYDEIVSIWLQRDKFQKAFPSITEEFKKFEIVLNRHQFKPNRNPKEISEIQEAYEKYKATLKGVLNGI